MSVPWQAVLVIYRELDIRPDGGCMASVLLSGSVGVRCRQETPTAVAVMATSNHPSPDGANIIVT